MKKAVVIALIIALSVITVPIEADKNSPPSKPVVNGPTEGEAGKSYTYTAVSTDPDGDKIYYCFDWGDGNEFCTSLYPSGETVEASHTWQEEGTYKIKVVATDENGAESEPAYLTVKMPFIINENTKRLRVFIVEPTSRWRDYDGSPYRFAFLDFAYDDLISLTYSKTKYINIEWNPAKAGYSVNPDNIMAIAAVFDITPHEGYAYPPNRNPFNAYYVEACAAAMPGEERSNVRNEETTHTVLVEMGTATWCPYCPNMGKALEKIYESGEYPFYFVAMVYDMNSEAADRLIYDYNIYGFPTSFFDGGRKVIVGGISSESVYKNALSYCMKQDVFDMDLKIKVSWENDKLKMNISITSLEKKDDTPPTISVEKPKEGSIYIFDKEIISLPLQFALVIGKITIKANVEDESGVDVVIFKADGQEIHTDKEEPYEYLYDTPSGKHVITIEAYDVFENYAKADINIYAINI